MLNQDVTNMSSQKNGIFTVARNFFGSFKRFIDIQINVLRDPRFTALYDNPDTKFDLIFCGVFMNTYQFGVAAKFKAPLIVNWVSAPTVMTDRYMGNPTESSYVPNLMMPIKAGERMTFLQRMQNLLTNAAYDGMLRILDIQMNTYYKELFPNDGSFPTLYDMYKNISLLFCNSHFSEGAVRPNVPAIVEIGGIQIKDKSDPLPNDISEFLNSAKNDGAILFSLGSNFKGSNLKPEIATYIYNVLSKLKQKVIWKWEDLTNTPGNSTNILYKTWLPQDDILAHPNLKLFVTHAGKGGVIEAQYHGVPMVAIPIFADQHGNAEKIVKSGYGQMVDYLKFTEETFKIAIHEVLGNSVYEANVKQLSRLYRDRPLTARQNVLFWTEYVLRHHGAAHMQSPLVHTNLIESMNLDVFVVLFMVIYISYKILRLTVCYIYRKIFKNMSYSKEKLKNKVKSQ